MRSKCRALATLLALIPLLALAGCTPRSTLTPLTMKGKAAPPELRSHLLGRSLARLALMQSARASYDASFPALSPQPMRAVLLVDQARSGLRMEFLPPALPTSLLLFVSRELESSLLLPSTRQAFVSSQNAAGVLRSFFRIPIADADLGLLYLGILPRPAAELLGESGGSALTCEASRCLLQAIRSKDQWLLDRESGAVLAALLFDRFQRDPVIAIEIGYQPSWGDGAGDYTPPTNLRVSYPKHEINTELTLNKISLNPSLDPELFSVVIPSRYRLTTAPSFE